MNGYQTECDFVLTKSAFPRRDICSYDPKWTKQSPILCEASVLFSAFQKTICECCLIISRIWPYPRAWNKKNKDTLSSTKFK